MQIPRSLKTIINQIGLRIPGLRSSFRARNFCNYWSRFAPPGHYYSPIPSDEDIERWNKTRAAASELPGMDLRLEAQKDFVASLARNYAQIPFQAQAGAGLRYHFENGFYSYADAILLHLILRQLQPRQIVEIGSGFSSAVMLDTRELFLADATKLTFIEPYADRLKGLLHRDDAQHCIIIEKTVQDVGWKIFTALESGDVLFVDSSHVSKAGSDVNFLIFEVFPRLRPGVWIHIHDVFPDFDYPEEWLRGGRAWNESYLIRAFLQFNDSFEIILLGPLCINQNRDWFQAHMPDCLKNPGGSLWLRRKK